MPAIYCVVYYAYRKPNLTNHAIFNSEPVKEYYRSKKVGIPNCLNEVKLDLGDDPSILAYAADLGPLTWGTCRPNMRNGIKKGDYVCFYATDIENGQNTYYFSGYAKVADKITQADFLNNKGFRSPGKYANLLIKKYHKKYKWSEWPGEPNNKVTQVIINKLIENDCLLGNIKTEKKLQKLQKDITNLKDKSFKDNCWHPDWKNRTLKSAHNSKNGIVDPSELAENYISFDLANTHILKKPIKVIDKVGIVEGKAIPDWCNGVFDHLNKILNNKLFLKKGGGKSIENKPCPKTNFDEEKDLQKTLKDLVCKLKGISEGCDESRYNDLFITPENRIFGTNN